MHSPAKTPTRHRILVPYPPEVIVEIDKIVKNGNRSAYLVELARREIRRRQLLKVLEKKEPIWKMEDHPEIDDAGKWLRKMRVESDARFARIKKERGRK